MQRNVRLLVAFLFVSSTAMAAEPVLNLPAPITTEATGSGGSIVFFRATSDGVTIGDDEDGRGASAACSPSSGSTFPIQTTVVTCTARNEAGQTTTGSFTIRVVDTTAPALTLPNFVEVTTTGSTAPATWSASAYDAVDGNVAVVCTPPSGTIFITGTSLVECSSTDAHGNTATDSFEVVVAGSTPPVLHLNDQSEEATGPTGAVVVFDFLDQIDNVLCTPSSGSLFAVGTTTVNCSRDALSGSFIVNVTDTTPPVLTLPADITREATSPSGAAVSFTATATDLVDGTFPATCTPSSGSTFALGTTPVQCSATDAHGNSASRSFTVTVVDTTPPVLTVPADITAEATNPAGAAVSFIATATDLVDGTFPATCTPSSGSTFALGTTPVQCSATDAHGNSVSDTFTVTVVDTTPPVIVSVSATPATLWPPNKQMVGVTVTVDVEDAADPAPLVHIIAVTANEPITASDWVITGPLTVNLRADRSGTSKSGRIYTIYIEAVDSSGNATITSTTVIVPHDSGKRRAA